MELLILLGLVGVAGAFVGLSSDDDDPAPAEDPADPDIVSLNGGPRAEELEGTEADDSIDARGGDDLVQGFGGNDLLLGGSGEDTLVGGDGDDTIEGGRGDDRILDDVGDDSLIGGEGNDTIRSSIGNDTLFGGDGDDLIEASFRFAIPQPLPPTNLIDGGSGDDTLNFKDDSTVTGGSGADSFRLDEDMRNDVTSRIEDFDPDEDTLHVRVATAGSDGGGFSLVPRTDGLGNDLYLDDDLVVEILSAKDFTLADLDIDVGLFETPGGVTSYAVGPNDVEAGVQHIGSIGDDSITGSADDDRLQGNRGSDILIGGAGDDTLIADGGFAVVSRTEGLIVRVETDTADGGDGDDLIISRDGNIVTGGEGSDVFGIVPGPYFQIGDIQYPPTVITDFDPAEDQIVIASADVDATPVPSDITVRVLDDGTGAEVLVDGRVAAIVYGGQSLTADDVQIGDRDFTGDYRPP